MPSVVWSEGSLLAVNLSLKTLNWGEQSLGSHACSSCSDGALDSSVISRSASRIERSNKASIGLSCIRLWWRGIEPSMPISKEKKNTALLLQRPSREFNVRVRHEVFTYLLAYFIGPHRTPLFSEVSPLYKDRHDHHYYHYHFHYNYQYYH